MNDILPTFRAILTFPPGVERTDLAVVDETGYVAATRSWRPLSTDNPQTWDAALADLGWRRTGQWTATGSGFDAAVEWTADAG